MVIRALVYGSVQFESSGTARFLSRRKSRAAPLDSETVYHSPPMSTSTQKIATSALAGVPIATIAPAVRSNGSLTPVAGSIVTVSHVTVVVFGVGALMLHSDNNQLVAHTFQYCDLPFVHAS